MSISQTDQEKLKQVTIYYFQLFRLIHDWDVDESENLQQHCYMQLFGMMGLYAPMGNWELYLSQVGALTQNRIQRKSIGRLIDSLYSQITYFPITNLDLENFANRALEYYNKVYNNMATAYVPITNVKLAKHVPSLELAKSILFQGKPTSELAKHLKNLHQEITDIPQDIAFLKIDVMGDDESIENQVMAETEDALRVLRFVCWSGTSIKGNQRISYDIGRAVSYYQPNTSRPYFYVSNNIAYNRDFTHLPLPLEITTEMFELFQMLGLADINHHFAKRGNPISDKIILALEWYDSGLQAIRPRDALYRFIFCINGILSWGEKAISNYEELQRRYQKFLEVNPHSFFSDGTLSSDDATNRFKDLYAKQRGFIAHGYSSNPKFPITATNLKEAGLLARNAILLTMLTIKKHAEWVTLENIETWMKSKS